MPDLTDKQRRAVEMLVCQPDACSEAQLYASGFSFVHLAKLLIDGYPTVERKRINVGVSALVADYRRRPEGDRGMKKPRRSGAKERVKTLLAAAADDPPGDSSQSKVQAGSMP
jgi:hypothetical protein